MATDYRRGTGHVLLDANGVIHDADNPLPVSASVSATTTAKATAAAPLYVEGTDNPISCDLAGNLRTSGVPTGSAGTANASVVTVQGIASMTAIAVSGTFWQSTQPIS